MSQSTSFAEIKQRISITDGARFLGLTLTDDGKTLRTACPVCDGDDRTLSLLKENNAFKCFKSKQYGSVLDLVCHVKGIGLREAGKWLLEKEAEEWLDEYADADPEEGKEEKITKAPNFDAGKYLDSLSYDHEQVQALGFTPEDAKTLGIGFCSKGIHRGQVAVLLRKANGDAGVFISISDCKLPKRWSL